MELAEGLNFTLQEQKKGMDQELTLSISQLTPAAAGRG